MEACGIKLSRWGNIEVDETTYETSRPGVFAAGDVHTGPWIAVEAVGGGIEAAESIHRYLKGLDMKEGRVEGEEAHKRWREVPKDEEGQVREVMANLQPEYSCCSFEEIAKGYTEEQAKREAERCLNCGVCSECMQCVAACQAGAIDHNQKPETTEIEVGAVILSPGFQTFDPSKYKSYHYANYPNVVTSLEFERILSRLRPLRRPPGAALGPQGAAEGRLAPVRRLPGRQVPLLLFVGLLHVRHQRGGHRQGARALRPGRRHLLHGHAHLRQGVRAVLQPGPGAGGALHPLPDPHHRPGPRRQSDDQLHR